MPGIFQFGSSPDDTFDDTDAQRFNIQLADIGVVVGTGDEVQQYWKLCMDMLESELNTVFNSLSQQLNMNITGDEYNKRLENFKNSVSKIAWSDADITLSPTQFYLFYEYIRSKMYITFYKVSQRNNHFVLQNGDRFF